MINDFSLEFPHILNPFKLPESFTVDMMGILHQLEVVAICPNDDVFIPPRPKRIYERKPEDEPDIEIEAVEIVAYARKSVASDCLLPSLGIAEDVEL